MKKQPLVNICITTFNRLNYTKQCIDSILETTTDSIPFMITVIDNGSADGTPDYLKEIRKEEKIDTLILLKENIGIAKAQNIGWKMFEDVEYYIKLDNDILIHKAEWLSEMITILENTGKIGALGYQCADDRANYPIVIDGSVEYRTKNGNIGGALFCVPKHVKDKIGFWNENIQKSYGEEDAAYGWRITCAGYLNSYMIDTNAITHLPDRAEDINYRKFKDQEREENLKGDFWEILKEYKNDTRSLRVVTNILNEVDFELI